MSIWQQSSVQVLSSFLGRQRQGDNDNMDVTVRAIASNALRLASAALFRANSVQQQQLRMDEVLDSLEGISISNNKSPQKPQPMERLIQESDSELDISGSYETIEGTPPEFEDGRRVELGLPVYTLAEVAMHCTHRDAWMVIYDRIYDVTDFLQGHPGGLEVMEEYMGYDASMAFRSVGHSKHALRMLEEFLIGILPKEERMYNDDDVFSW